MSKPIIVCIDDEPTILESLKIALKKAVGDDYLIETAEGGEDALELLSELLEDEYEVALVISDYLMPNIKGDELLKRIHEILPQTIKIMLTGQADLEAVGNAIKYANLYRYIAKPWQNEDLILTVTEAVRSYFKEKQLAEQNAKLQRSNEELETLVEQRTAALSQSEEKFAKAFRASPNPITITRLADGCHIEVNDAFCQMIGYRREEVIGRTALELGLWVNQEKRDRLFQLLVEKGTVRNYEFDSLTKTGEVRTTLLSAELIDIAGQTCLISVSQDISDRKQAEVALQKALLAAEVANRAKSEFLANMTHELRTPLNAILGFAQVMNRDVSLCPEQEKYLGIISRSGEHLLGLINDILDMSKIEAGRISFNETSFDLYRLLDSLEEMFQLKAQSKSLKLIFERTPDVPQYVQTDEGKLRQVLINLLGNAIKFTQEGRVRLRVGMGNMQWRIGTGEGEHQTPNNKQQTTILFEVEDTGSGIPPEDIDTLFEAFTQTAVGRKSQEGTGLGLPISRKFVQLMGGELLVSSTVGQGATFKFDVQMKLAQATDIQTSQPTGRVIGLAPDQPVYRLLVVEDQWANRLLLVKLLTAVGFQVREATNGEEAVALWESWQPHLIWMDIRMPVMDGYETTKAIKQAPNGQHTVIIALTASAFEEDREAILRAGCDDFMPKPFQEDILFEKMAAHLGVRYVYQEQGQPTSSEPEAMVERLTPEALAVMPPEWLAQLRLAAEGCQDEEILILIEQIPEQYAALKLALTDLVDNFRLDLIVDLTQACTNV
jgi:PAS domain S-box-containing protein